jgi:hypothetical protein
MAEIKSFLPVKMVCGMIASKKEHFQRAEEILTEMHGPADSRSPLFDFDMTNYYEPQMGKGLKRTFISFERLIDPARLSEIKIRTNALEDEIRQEFQEDFRIINLDPGYITRAALIMATAKDFSHRIPLQRGIYGHLEFLFSKTGIRRLDWTYPDFANEGYSRYFMDVRRLYLGQLLSGSYS